MHEPRRSFRHLTGFFVLIGALGTFVVGLGFTPAAFAVSSGDAQAHTMPTAPSTACPV
jgi:hypothetical protein